MSQRFPPPLPPSSSSTQLVPPDPFRPAPRGSNQHSVNRFSGVGSSVSPYQPPPCIQPPNYSVQAPPRTLIPLVHPVIPNLIYPVPPPPLRNAPPRQFMYCPPPRPPRPTFTYCLPDTQRPCVVPVVQSVDPCAQTERSVEMEDVTRLTEKIMIEKSKEVVQNAKVVTKTQRLESTSGVNTSHRRRVASEDRLKRPTKFVGRMKFWNDLPDPTHQPKLYYQSSKRRLHNRFTKYRNTSLEKQQRPEIYAEPDLGIPLDLLDLSVFNPPKGAHLCLDPEDEELLRDDDYETPLSEDEFIKNERPDGRDVPWLLRTTHCSSSRTTMPRNKQSFTDVRMKELMEKRGNQIMPDEGNTRKNQIQDIEDSFEACKIPPVHATNKNLHPLECLPLLPDSDREGDQFVVATFKTSPTEESEIYKKLDKSVRDAHESQAIMKSFQETTSDKTKPDKVLVYMVPSVDELSKDMYDGNEDISYNWVRKYHCDVRGEDAHHPTYLLTFHEKEAHYTPLPTKLVMRKKRAMGKKTSDEVEDLPARSRVTIRRKPKGSVVESKETVLAYSGDSGARKSSASASAAQHVDNSSLQAATVMQDSGINHSGAAESNTRPKRFTKKPSYLADYKC